MNKVLVCPQCGTGDVLRSNCFSFVEWLADALWISPFRCQQCGHRFSALRVGRCYSARLVDRREYKRIPVRLSLSFSRGRIGGKGTVTDISMGGCVIESDAPVKTDDICTYNCILRPTNRPSKLRRWCDRSRRQESE